MLKKFTAKIMTAALLMSCLIVPTGATTEQFSDVPATSYAYNDILLLREKGIAGGIGNNKYGTTQTITRGEFVTMLSRLMKWDVTTPTSVGFTDISATDPIYSYAYPHVCAAVKLGALQGGTLFRPAEPITREEIAVMLINSLGYESLSRDKLVYDMASPFVDMTATTHPNTYSKLIMAYDFGIVTGTTTDGVTRFMPDDSATREQAAAMMVRLFNRYSAPLNNIHGFYNVDKFAKDQTYIMDKSQSTSFAWAKLEYWNSKNGAYLNMTSANSNGWYPPPTAAALIAQAKQFGGIANLAVQMSDYQKVTLPDGKEYRDYELILKDPAQRAQAISQLVSQMDNGYTGVTIDFEGFKKPETAPLLNAFLQELDTALAAKNPNLLLYIAVPVRDWYKGYDFRTIGEICDKVILMAHDYANTTLPEYMANTDLPKTAVTPFNRIYSALRDVTNPVDGVTDRSKIMLAVSFAYVRWEIKDGKVTNFAKAGRSDTRSLYKRLMNPETTKGYDVTLQNPWVRYNDERPGMSDVVWYEDSRSIAAKIDLAAMFGIKDVSLWQLGVVPDYNDEGINFDVWRTILNKQLVK